jgi:predicted dithiol-disulfide oxidoreductase (DUF899 family)
MTLACPGPDRLPAWRAGPRPSLHEAPRLTQPIGCHTVAINRLLLTGGSQAFPDRIERNIEVAQPLGPASDLAARLPITRQAIAKHLALLTEAGLVRPEPGGATSGALPAALAADAGGAAVPSRAGPRLGRPARRAAEPPRRACSLGPAPSGLTKPEDIIDASMKTPPIVTAQEWEEARQQLLVKEKELTRARDALAAQRRRMPWLAVEKDYEFDGPEGKTSLLDLFEGRRQLVIYRAFFEPGVVGWPDHACHGCSLMADQVAHLTHLNARDTTFAYASRAPQPDIARLKARMGWTMPWYTVTDDWDTDFGVDEYHGTNAFIRDGDQVYRTYFLNNRGDEALGSTWSYLDMTALGRQELWEDSPEGYPQSAPYNWWNWHDAYDHPELTQGRMKEWE